MTKKEQHSIFFHIHFRPPSSPPAPVRAQIVIISGVCHYVPCHIVLFSFSAGEGPLVGGRAAWWCRSINACPVGSWAQPAISSTPSAFRLATPQPFPLLPFSFSKRGEREMKIRPSVSPFRYGHKNPPPLFAMGIYLSFRSTHEKKNSGTLAPSRRGGRGRGGPDPATSRPSGPGRVC